MSLNVEKTHFMIFRSKGKRVQCDDKVQIMGTNIEQVHHTKFLGVIIDSTLSWKNHIDYICSKVSKNIVS